MNKRDSKYFPLNGNDYALKIAFVGSSYTGKTSIFKLFCEKNFGFTSVLQSHESSPTIGVDFGAINYEYDNHKFKLQYWDTAGHEKFKTITRSYYRNVYAIFLVFDLHNYRSFLDLHFWINDIKRTVNSATEIVLIGNKKDLTNIIDREEIDTFCRNNNILEYFDISVKDAIIHKINLDYINDCILEKFLNTENKNLPGIKINSEKGNVIVKTKNCCY